MTKFTLILHFSVSLSEFHNIPNKEVSPECLGAYLQAILLSQLHKLKQPLDMIILTYSIKFSSTPILFTPVIQLST